MLSVSDVLESDGVACAVYLAENHTDELVGAMSRLSLIRPTGSVSGEAGGVSVLIGGLIGWYPIALCGINITKLLIDTLHISRVRKAGASMTDEHSVQSPSVTASKQSTAHSAAEALAREYPDFWTLLSDENAFLKLYSLCMLILEACYVTDDKLTVNDFYP